MHAWQKQIRAIPGPIRGLAIVGSLGLAGYWWATYSGLYRWLAELQIAWFDGYELILTGVLCCLFTVLPTMLVLVVISRRLPPPADRPSMSAAEVEAWIQGHYGRIVVGALSVGLLGVGLFQLVAYARLGELTDFDVAAVEEGAAPQSRYVRLDGAPEWSQAVGVEGEHDVTFYVPLRSAPRAPVAVVLEVAESQLKYGGVNRSQRHFEGTLSSNLTGLARTVLVKKGVKFAEPLWVLDAGHSPRETRDMGAAFTTMGGIGSLLLAAWIAFRRRRVSRGRGA
jgi:hypothetical protein